MSERIDLSPSLGPARAQLLAWAGVALVDAVGIALTVPLPRLIGVRALHHAYAAGQALALGFVSFCVVWAWGRLVAPRLARLTLGRAGRLAHLVAPFLALYGVALAVSALVAAPDLSGFASRSGGAHPGALLALSTAMVALIVTGAAAVGALLDRPWWRWGAVLVAAAVAAVNHVVLPSNYLGAHLFCAWIAALLAGGALSHASVPRVFGNAKPRVARTIALALLAVASLVTLVRDPGDRVRSEIYKDSASALAPLLGALRQQLANVAHPAEVPPAQRDWFVDRAGAADVPPTKPVSTVEAPIILLVTVDSLRADLLSSGKYDAQLPEMARLRDGGAYFTEAYAPGSQTISSFAAIFSGRHYSQLYWSKMPGSDIWPFEDRSRGLGDELTQGGVTSVSLSSKGWLTNKFGIVRHFTEDPIIPSEAYSALGVEVTDMAIARLKKPIDRPLFVAFHYMDPHEPYDRAGKQGTPFERYVREVAIVDREIVRLRRAIDALGLTHRTTMILSADHGEAFGEHNTYYHQVSLYNELVHVPFIVLGPDVKRRRVTEPVSLVDIGPTVLDRFGLATPGYFMGQSLEPTLRGESRSFTRPIVAEGRLKQMMLLPGGLKIIRDQRSGTQEIYDLTQDPGELENLIDDLPDAQSKMNLLDAFFRVHTLKRPGYVPPYRR